MAGIVIDGFCRDTATLKRMTMPIYARGATPRAVRAMITPEVNVPVLLGNVTVKEKVCSPSGSSRWQQPHRPQASVIIRRHRFDLLG
jgi:hypothetical protein